MRQAAETKLHLLHVFSTFAVGGAQIRFSSLANALAGKYRHTVLAMDGNIAAATRLSPDVDCRFETMPVVKTGGISLANLGNAWRLLRKLRPDLLLTYNWGSIEWAMANRLLPVCRHLHIEDGFGPDESPTRQNRRRVLVRRLVLAGRTRVIVPSETLRDIAVRVWRLAPGRVIHLPNGIDCARFAQSPDPSLLASLRLDEPGPVIGTVAALRPEKNLGRLLRVFAALPRDLDARLVVVGDGPARDQIAREATALGVADRVVLTGSLANPERLLRRFDVFALTSDTEQMPVSVLEAMAAGLPLVSTDVGDVRQMVAPENGEFVIPCADEQGFEAGLCSLLPDAPRRAAIGRANLERVRGTYDIATMISRYDALFSAGDPTRCKR